MPDPNPTDTTPSNAPLGLPCPSGAETIVKEQVVKLDSLGPMVVNAVRSST